MIEFTQKNFRRKILWVNFVVVLKMAFTRVVQFHPDQLTQVLKIVAASIPSTTSTSDPLTVSTLSPSSNESDFPAKKLVVPSLTGHPVSDTIISMIQEGKLPKPPALSKPILTISEGILTLFLNSRKAIIGADFVIKPVG